MRSQQGLPDVFIHHSATEPPFWYLDSKPIYRGIYWFICTVSHCPLESRCVMLPCGVLRAGQWGWLHTELHQQLAAFSFLMLFQCKCSQNCFTSRLKLHTWHLSILTYHVQRHGVTWTVAIQTCKIKLPFHELHWKLETCFHCHQVPSWCP